MHLLYSLLWITSIVGFASKVYQVHSSRHFCHIKLSTGQQIHYVVSDVKAFTHIIPWLKIQSCHLYSSITNHLEIPIYPSRINLMSTSLIATFLCNVLMTDSVLAIISFQTSLSKITSVFWGWYFVIFIFVSLVSSTKLCLFRDNRMIANPKTWIFTSKSCLTVREFSSRPV